MDLWAGSPQCSPPNSFQPWHCHWDSGAKAPKTSRGVLCSLCLCTRTKPWTKIVELMKATLFNKSLPNSCGYQEEEFITQAYLYLLPEWSAQWLLDFVVSENNLSYIPLIARSPATFSSASYSTRDFPVQLSASPVVSVKNTKNITFLQQLYTTKAAHISSMGWQRFLCAMKILFCSRWQHSLQVLKALTPGT